MVPGVLVKATTNPSISAFFVWLQIVISGLPLDVDNGGAEAQPDNRIKIKIILIFFTHPP